MLRLAAGRHFHLFLEEGAFHCNSFGSCCWIVLGCCSQLGTIHGGVAVEIACWKHLKIDNGTLENSFLFFTSQLTFVVVVRYLTLALRLARIHLAPLGHLIPLLLH